MPKIEFKFSSCSVLGEKKKAIALSNAAYHWNGSPKLFLYSCLRRSGAVLGGQRAAERLQLLSAANMSAPQSYSEKTEQRSYSLNVREGGNYREQEVFEVEWGVGRKVDSKYFMKNGPKNALCPGIAPFYEHTQGREVEHQA